MARRRGAECSRGVSGVDRSRSKNYAQFKLQQLEIEFHTWGGRRDGAGRPRLPRGPVPHRRRERHARSRPVHVTMRARRGLPTFREPVLFRVVRERIRAANRARGDAFRVVHFSVQDDHLHLVVEAHDAAALARGVQGLAIRLARGLNGTLGVRGKVWGDRFHSRELGSPRAVRNAIVYVLMNGKKHGVWRGAIDPLSSAPWFDGFAERVGRVDDDAPVRAPRTWLAGVGWRRRGLLRLDERPRAPC